MNTEKDTQAAAKLFAKKLRAPVTVAFTGGLGAGKTTFIRYLCRELGYDGAVTSPTFSIMNEYRAPELTIYHFDMYRLSGADALYDIGYYDTVDKGVSLIEWSENVKGGLEGDIITVALSFDGQTRKITLPEI